MFSVKSSDIDESEIITGKTSKGSSLKASSSTNDQD
jgi:hypothetical protein